MLGALGALGVLLGRSRVVLVGGFVSVAAAEVLLGRDLAPHRFGSALASASGLGAGVLGLAVIGALAALLVPLPWAVPPAIVALAPFRLPFDVGTHKRFFIGLGESGALGRLVPLYVVLAAAAAALVWRLRARRAACGVAPVARRLGGALVGLMSLSLLWAHDSAASTNRLASSCSRSPSPRGRRALAVSPVAHTRARDRGGRPRMPVRRRRHRRGLDHRLLFYEPKLAVANSYTSYFRVRRSSQTRRSTRATS